MLPCIIAILLTFSCNLTANVDTCTTSLWRYLPIGEKELLNVAITWPLMKALPEGARRNNFLHSTGYALPDGSLPQNAVVASIAGCQAGTHQLELLYVKAQEGEHDDNVYLVSWLADSIASRSLIAALQTTCEFTFLRACSVEAGTTLLIQQLQHSFNCDNEEFIKTENLPGFKVVVKPNNEIEEIVTLDEQ